MIPDSMYIVRRMRPGGAQPFPSPRPPASDYRTANGRLADSGKAFRYDIDDGKFSDTGRLLRQAYKDLDPIRLLAWRE